MELAWIDGVDEDTGEEYTELVDESTPEQDAAWEEYNRKAQQMLKDAVSEVFDKAWEGSVEEKQK